METAPNPKWFTVATCGDVTICNFNEKRFIDGHSIQLMGSELFRQVDELGRKWILLDFTKVELISSAVLGVLINLNRKARTAGGKVVLANVCKEITEVLELTKLNQILALAGSLEEGQKTLSSLAAK
jgi:anti-sigma B factor antagonist